MNRKHTSKQGSTKTEKMLSGSKGVWYRVHRENPMTTTSGPYHIGNIWWENRRWHTSPACMMTIWPGVYATREEATRALCSVDDSRGAAAQRDEA